MKRRQQVLELIGLYKERTGRDDITTDSIISFIENNKLPQHLTHFKNCTKREIAHLLASYAKEKECEGNRTVFFF